MSELASNALTEKIKSFGRSQIGRYVLLAPTALSVLANLDGIGRLASSLVGLWKPLLSRLIDTVLSVDLPFPLSRDWAEAIVMFVFFAPFIVGGFSSVVTGKEARVSWTALALSIPAWFLLFNGFASGSDQRSVPEWAGVLTAVLVLGLLPLPLIWLVLKVTKKERRSVPRIAYPLTLSVFLCLAIFLAYLNGAADVTLAISTATFVVICVGLPFINPKRLVDVAVLVLGIVAISLSADFVRSLVPVTNS